MCGIRWYGALFPKEKIVKTGNPVRADLVNLGIDKEEALSHFGLKTGKKTLLVLGGSLGARRINQLVESELVFIKNLGIQVVWQCGKLYYEEYKKYESDRVRTKAFIDQMEYAYAAADMIISRAGAGSVSELCLVGKPVIFVPSPNVAEDHQTKNAEALMAQKAALMLKERDLDDRFEGVFEELVRSESKQRLLAENIKKLAMPKATEQIVDEVEKLLNHKDGKRG